jgi:5-formyltetrahydrofolate cyclo-ligase
MLVLEQKKILRKEMRQKRKLLSEEEMKKEAGRALEKILSVPEYFECRSLFVYVSYQEELSTVGLIEAAFLDGKRVAVPKVISDHRMEFFEISDRKELKSGYMGILEPEGLAEPVFPDEKSLLVLPGMLFDRTGKRMGYGGGFYDEYLGRCKKSGKKPVTAGYAYEFQLFERRNVSEEAFADGRFPAEEHDQRVDMVITPEEVIYMKI